jgi:hypothetical protein
MSNLREQMRNHHDPRVRAMYARPNDPVKPAAAIPRSAQRPAPVTAHAALPVRRLAPAPAPVRPAADFTHLVGGDLPRGALRPPGWHPAAIVQPDAMITAEDGAHAAQRILTSATRARTAHGAEFADMTDALGAPISEAARRVVLAGRRREAGTWQ